jgi:IS30 family transposase
MPYQHLTPSERKVIDSMRRAGYTQVKIAQALQRRQSTISRELARNSEPDGHYNPHMGNLLYWRRREQVYKRTKRGNKDLMDYVKSKLKQKWSPEQIAGHLRHVRFPENRSKWISYQTIYRHVWEDKAHGGTLFRQLRRGHRKYGKRGTGRHPNTYLKGRVSIEKRPEVVSQRARVGDWEGDTVYGAQRRGRFATLVERRSGFLAASLMSDATARSLNQAVLRCLKDLPKAAVHTLTVDNGKEFARFKELEEALEMNVYFAHPYSAWERATNENTNGLLRQYLPRKTNLSKLTPEQLERIVQCLNDRPRKRLEYRTPREVFTESAYALDT